MGDGKGNNSFWFGVIILLSYGVFQWLLPFLFHPAFLKSPAHDIFAIISGVGTIVGAILNFTGGFDEDKGRVAAGVAAVLLNVVLIGIQFAQLNGG